MLSFSTSNDKLKSKLLFVLACRHRLDVQKSITVRPIMASGGVAPVHSSRACKRQTDHMDNTVGQCVLGTCFSRPDRSPGSSEGRPVQSMQLLGIERKGQWYPCEGHKQSNPARSDSMSVPARLGRKLAVYDAFETNRLVSRRRTRTTADPTANSTIRRSWHMGACKSSSC